MLAPVTPSSGGSVEGALERPRANDATRMDAVAPGSGTTAGVHQDELGRLRGRSGAPSRGNERLASGPDRAGRRVEGLGEPPRVDGRTAIGNSRRPTCSAQDAVPARPRRHSSTTRSIGRTAARLCDDPAPASSIRARTDTGVALVINSVTADARHMSSPRWACTGRWTPSCSSATQVGVRKPDAQIFREALDALDGRARAGRCSWTTSPSTWTAPARPRDQNRRGSTASCRRRRDAAATR